MSGKSSADLCGSREVGTSPKRRSGSARLVLTYQVRQSATNFTTIERRSRDNAQNIDH
jgi:hypothetical protein